MDLRTCCVLMSTPDNQQPNPGCEWYHPTTISGLRQQNIRISQAGETINLAE